MAFINGLDVSHHQEDIIWSAVVKAGMRFAYAKASEGIGLQDSKFDDNWEGMKKAGIIRGAYHFFHPALPPEKQVKNFLGVVGPLLPGDLPPALDLEETGKDHDEWPSIPMASRLGMVMTWLKAVEAAVGIRPVIYTRAGWMKQFLPSAPGLADYPLWVASYRANAVKPTVPANWKAWTMWQFSEAGSVAGVKGPCDLNRFNGTLASLRQFCKPAAMADAASTSLRASAAKPVARELVAGAAKPKARKSAKSA